MMKKSCTHINIAYSIYLSKLKREGKLQKDFRLEDIDPTMLAKQLKERKKSADHLTTIVADTVKN